jgi:hypothetical protein
LRLDEALIVDLFPVNQDDGNLLPYNWSLFNQPQIGSPLFPAQDGLCGLADAAEDQDVGRVASRRHSRRKRRRVEDALRIINTVNLAQFVG